MTLSSTCNSSYSHHVSSCVTGADVDVISVVVLPVVTVGRGVETIPDYILIQPHLRSSQN